MEKIIKKIWEYCWSWLVTEILLWIFKQIWKLRPFREELSIMFTLALIQSIPSFLTICYILILILDFVYKLKKSPFEILPGNSSFFAETKVCESCNKTMSVELPYIIPIKNNGKKLIEQVSVMFNNRYAINEETKSKYCDLNSGAVGYFVFHLTKDQKEIEVTVTGKNMLPSSKILFIKPPA